MVRKVVTWVVIADGARARIYRNDGPGKGLEAMPDLSMTGDRRKEREIMADKPGRSFDSHGQGRHSMEPTTDPREILERQFLGELAETLQSAASAGEFDRLVLAAAPRALGELREMMPRAVADRISAEIAKDLTKLPSGDLPKHLADVMAV
ncbi:MAG: host attachment protein [Hyphomicrobiales bacterium]|nr:host attachment protein [Hyphomicrobiales bacterium]